MADRIPAPAVRKPRKSQKRRRTAAAFVRLRPDELEAIEARAEAAGKPVARYLRDLGLGDGTDPAPPVAADLDPESALVNAEQAIGQVIRKLESVLADTDRGQDSRKLARVLLDMLEPWTGQPRSLKMPGEDRVRQAVAEYEGALDAVRQAVDLLAARIRSAEDDRVIAEAREGLRVLEGSETPAAGTGPDDSAREPASAHEKAQDRPGGKDGTEGESREAFVRRYRVVVDEDGEIQLIGWCAEAIGCLFHRAYDQIQGVTLGELIDAATEHEGEQGERAHAYLAEINGEDDHG
jgi:hypothetical protein